MSCKGKLSNLPVISNIDQQFKKLTASNLEGLSPKQKAQQIANSFGGMAGDLKNQIGNQVENFTNDATGKLAELGGLISGLGTDLKAGIPEDLRGIKKGIADAIQSTKDQIAEQYNNIKDLLSCEESTTSDELTQTQEATKIKSSVMATSVSKTKTLSNKEIKNISEVSTVKEQKVNQITTNTITEGSVKASNSQSNKSMVNMQTQSLSALQTTSTPKADKFKTDMGMLYTEYSSLIDEINSELKILFTNAKLFIDDDKIVSGRVVSRAVTYTLVDNFNVLDKLYTQSQISLDLAKFNLTINNKQCYLAKFATLKLNNKMTSETYIKNVNKILDERLTLIRAGESSVPKKDLIIKTIKGSLI